MTNRNMILVRWIFGGVVLLAVLGWFVYDFLPTGPVVRRSSPAAAEENVSLPTEEHRAQLRDAVLAARIVRSMHGPSATPPPDGSLLAAQRVQNARDQVRISIILRGAKENLALIDGALYAPGDDLPDGRTVRTIHPDGVELLFSNFIETIPWNPPGTVHLVKSSGPAAQPSDDTEANATSSRDQ